LSSKDGDKAVVNIDYKGNIFGMGESGISNGIKTALK
jgi:hypothetical protein